MPKEIIKIEKNIWFEKLIDDCQLIRYKGATDFIRSFHELGIRVNKDILKFEKSEYGSHTIEELERKADFSKNFLYRPIQFAKNYPDVEKAILDRGLKSWRDVRKLLPGKEEIEFPYKLFDIWNFQGCDEKYGDPTYPGRIPGQLIKNILYYFTKPEDLIIDPMAGGGTTIDVCKEMKRRCLAYDINPFREDIKQWDLRKGFPKKAEGCDLIFLDPPYWKKKVEEYAENSISKLDRNNYLAFFKKLAIDCKDTLKPKGIVAFLMSNYIDYKKPSDSVFTADYYQFFLKAGFETLYEIQTPLSTQQYKNYDVERAKKNKELLIISRSLYIFQYGKVS